jgi:hypothetical protein
VRELNWRRCEGDRIPEAELASRENPLFEVSRFHAEGQFATSMSLAPEVLEGGIRKDLFDLVGEGRRP